MTDDTLLIELADGRSISVPLAWYPRLMRGSLQERGNYRLIGGGEGIHWPDLDEDISVEGFWLVVLPARIRVLSRNGLICVPARMRPHR